MAVDESICGTTVSYNVARKNKGHRFDSVIHIDVKRGYFWKRSMITYPEAPQIVPSTNPQCDRWHPILS